MWLSFLVVMLHQRMNLCRFGLQPQAVRKISGK